MQSRVIELEAELAAEKQSHAELRKAYGEIRERLTKAQSVSLDVEKRRHAATKAQMEAGLFNVNERLRKALRSARVQAKVVKQVAEIHKEICGSK